MIDLLCIVFVKEGKSPWCSGASSKECWTYTRQLAREEVSSVFLNNSVMPNKSGIIYPPEFDWWPNNQGRSVVFMVMEFNSKSTFCHRCHVLTAICSYVTKAVRNILKPFFFPSVIGTSSLRRAAQLKKRFPQLEFENIVSCPFLSFCVCGCLYIINGRSFIIDFDGLPKQARISWVFVTPASFPIMYIAF